MEMVVVRRFFLPETPDLLGQLVRQSQVTSRGIDAFAAWANGDPAQADTVRACEHEADDVRRELQRGLRVAFTTPLDAEDMYELSERLDQVLNDCKNAVREAEVMGLRPDGAVVEMTTHVCSGIAHVHEAIPRLVADRDGATHHADLCVASARALEKSYRQAMVDLLSVDDVRELLSRRELYRWWARCSDDLVRVAHRIWYAVVKEG
jgi:uncharacterized protein Yka (UPF0111/DUF47 family)